MSLEAFRGVAASNDIFHESCVIYQLGGDIGLLIIMVPKVLNTHFIICWLWFLIQNLDWFKLAHSSNNSNIQKGNFYLSSFGLYINLTSIVLSMKDLTNKNTWGMLDISFKTKTKVHIHEWKK